MWVYFTLSLIRPILFGRKEIPDNIPKNHFISQDNALKLFYSNKDPITITWLGHSSFLIKIKNKIILTDPYLSKIAGEYGFGPSRYVEPGIILEEIPKVDIILISHNHYDHLDTKTLFNLSGKKNIQVLCPLKLSYIIKNLGYEINFSRNGSSDIIVNNSIKIRVDGNIGDMYKIGIYD